MRKNPMLLLIHKRRWGSSRKTIFSFKLTCTDLKEQWPLQSPSGPLENSTRKAASLEAEVRQLSPAWPAPGIISWIPTIFTILSWLFRSEWVNEWKAREGRREGGKKERRKERLSDAQGGVSVTECGFPLALIVNEPVHLAKVFTWTTCT